MSDPYALVDFVATEPHYLDHLLPVWRAVSRKGRFYAPGVNVDGFVNGLPPREGGPIVGASWSDLSRLRLRRRALLEHGAGQSYGTHASNPGGNRKGISLFLHPNEASAARDREANPDAEVVVVGCPKLDAFHVAPPRPPNNRAPVVAISFHWNNIICLEAGTAWREFKGALPALAEHHQVLGHAHPRMIRRIEPVYERLGIEVVHSFGEVLRRASLLVVDNSSIGPEFASTGRPIVWTSASWWRREVHHGGRFWDWLPMGVHCEEPERLLGAVEEALEDSPAQSQCREEMVSRVYDFASDGQAAARAAQAIEQWA